MRICKRRCHVFYVRTAAGEVRQASCSKRLRKLSPRACSTFLCFPPANFSTESLADADDAAQMRLLRLGFFRLRRPVSIPVSHADNFSNKRESAVYPCVLHYTGPTRAFLPETFCRKARYHAANALQSNQPCFPSEVLSRIENKTF